MSETLPAPDAQRPLRRLSGEAAEALAGKFIVYEDLRSAYRAIKLWIERYNGGGQLGEDDRTIAFSLFRDGVTRFCGCFGAAAPLLPAARVYAAHPGGDAYFGWLNTVSDSFASHASGPLKECIVGVELDDDGNIVGHGHLFRFYQGPQPADAPQILRFFAVAVKYAEKEIGQLGEAALAAAAVLSPADRLALQAADVSGPELDRIRTEWGKAKPNGSFPAESA